MHSSPPAQPARLPLRRTLSLAYESVLHGFDALLRLAWPWMLVVLPLEIAHNWWSYPGLRALSHAGDAPAPPPSPLIERLIEPVWTLLLLVPLSAIAVGWHRYLLRGEEPVAGAPRLAGAIWPYLGMALFLTIVVYLPFLPFELAPTPADDEFPALAFAALAAALVAITVTARLSLVLPAIAIDGPGRSLSEVWRATRGHSLKMLAGTFLAAVPVFAVSALAYSLASSLPSRLAFAVVAGGLGVVGLLLMTIGVAFLSFAWRHFFAAAPPAGSA